MKKLSVVVGRFQLPALHAGHRKLLDYAQQVGDSLLVVLGVSEAQASLKNPLSFDDRKIMIQEAYPNAVVLKHPNNRSDQVWSEKLDALIRENFPDHVPSLIGSRDSFANAYHGTLPVILIPGDMSISGTKERAKKFEPKCSLSYRMGKVDAHKAIHPASFQCVDIALLRHPQNEILLGRKPTDPKNIWRLPGGFVDPKDASLESAAARELSEEVVGVMTHELKYLGSTRSADFRYKDEESKIMTALFLTYHMGGVANAGDDLCEVRWFSLSEAEVVINPEHKDLLDRVIKEVGK